MSTASTARPGIREQHLLRKQDNPLFDEAQRQVSNEDLYQARLEDGIESDKFADAFQALVNKAVELKPNTPSETILEIKEQLDQSYQQACAMPGDQQPMKDAIRKLLAVIMKAVWNGVGNDAFARQQLQEEEIARKAHFELQELPLVAALTHPESPIMENELIPSLLSEPEQTLVGTLQLFDENQVAAIQSDAESFLRQRDPGRTFTAAWKRLEVIQEYYRALQPDSLAN